MSWREVKIGDLGKVITGNTPPKKNPEFYGDSFKFIKPTDMIIDNKYTPVTEECYSQLAYEKYINSLIPPFSTCVVTIGSIGKKMTMTNEYSFVNQAVNAVVPFEDKYDNHFVYYALKNILEKVKNADTGASSGRENVSKSNFMSLSLTVPKSLETQKRIASILSNYDDLIENNLKGIKLLEETTQNIYKEWFVNFRFPNYENTAFDAASGLPVGWEVVKLSETIEFKVDNRGRNPEYYSETGIPVIDNFLLKDSMAINLSNCKRYIDENIFNNFIRKYLEPNDVLITLVGNLGSISLAPQTKSVIIQNTIGLRSNNLISQYFLFCFLLLNKDKIQNMNRGVAQPSVLVGDLFNLEVLIPTKKHINSFSLKVESIFNMVSILGVQNQKLKEARDILLPRLMNRTIEV
jgi:type I restriction enzyme S subunit